MKVVVLLLFAVLAGRSSLAANSPSSSSMDERWTVRGFYGYESVSPGDLNGLASSLGTTPKLNSINSGFYYAGGLGFKLNHHWEVFGRYEVQDLKNLVNTTSPAVSNSGFEILQNEIWAGVNYHFLKEAKWYSFVGLGLGYPVYSHVTAWLSTRSDYDADKTLGYLGQAVLGYHLFRHLSVFVLGEYQNSVSGNLKTTSGSTLLNSSGGNAKADISGLRVAAGLAFHF